MKVNIAFPFCLNNKDTDITSPESRGAEDSKSQDLAKSQINLHVPMAARY